jgi:hypothetical protein
MCCPARYAGYRRSPADTPGLLKAECPGALSCGDAPALGCSVSVGEHTFPIDVQHLKFCFSAAHHQLQRLSKMAVKAGMSSKPKSQIQHLTRLQHRQAGRPGRTAPQRQPAIRRCRGRGGQIRGESRAGRRAGAPGAGTRPGPGDRCGSSSTAAQIRICTAGRFGLLCRHQRSTWRSRWSVHGVGRWRPQEENAAASFHDGEWRRMCITAGPTGPGPR